MLDEIGRDDLSQVAGAAGAWRRARSGRRNYARRIRPDFLQFLLALRIVGPVSVGDEFILMGAFSHIDAGRWNFPSASAIHGRRILRPAVENRQRPRHALSGVSLAAGRKQRRDDKAIEFQRAICRNRLPPMARCEPTRRRRIKFCAKSEPNAGRNEPLRPDLSMELLVDVHGSQTCSADHKSQCRDFRAIATAVSQIDHGGGIPRNHQVRLQDLRRAFHLSADTLNQPFTRMHARLVEREMNAGQKPD